ncbi:AsmA family protein [Flavobacterium cerinum]|uniref:DUF748 domain-containing protein n=1 Tax=Flavobacterium cerinum TaxID=2502784 RepID=A0A3S3S7X7_9FLAO|nr:hypothetical protein [Flavobacterium cerinum]RWW92381.1 hypothetical protein EPI11_15860 [Flavobacterium cerinum]
MSLPKKIIISIVSLVVLLAIINFGLSYWITKKLPGILQSEKDFPYNISYDKLDLRLLSGSFTIHDAYIAAKDSSVTDIKKAAFGKIATIEVQNFNLWTLLRNNKIKVKKVIITSPDIMLKHRKNQYNAQDDFVKPFKNTITTGSLEIINGNFKMMDSLQNFTLKAANINFSLTNIKIDSTTVTENIPVRYRDYSLKCDSLFYRVNKFYNITAENITTTDSTLAITNLKYIPQQTRKQFNTLIPVEKDQFAITAEKINVPNLNWGYYNDTLYVHTPEITLEKVNANIYRGKMPKDDLTRKKLYSELLRTIPFDLKVDKMLLKNSTVVYEEQLEYSRPAAKVSFSKFYATLSNIYSPVQKTKLPNTTIDVQCMFMRSAPLKVNWSFNTMNTSDAFTITGHLQNIKSEEIDPVTKPLMNVTTHGDLDEVKFTFYGNRESGKGTFAINYNDLKVDIYKKDGKKRNDLVSAIGNLLVKDDTKDRLKKTEVEVDRKKDKSVFNFLWRFVEQGLKQTVLPKTVAKIATKKKEKKK